MARPLTGCSTEETRRGQRDRRTGVFVVVETGEGWRLEPPGGG
jgi:hypothetical protein